MCDDRTHSITISYDSFAVLCNSHSRFRVDSQLFKRSGPATESIMSLKYVQRKNGVNIKIALT